MGNLSKNFDREEFACKCGCGFDVVDAETLKIVQGIRDFFGVAVKVTSGCRCYSHNLKVGGVSNSRHKLGKACDMQISGVEPAQVRDYIDTRYGNKYAVGIYDTFTHVDCGKYKRWDNRS